MAGSIRCHAEHRRPARRRRGRSRGGVVEREAEARLGDVGASDGGTRARAAHTLQGQLGNVAVQRLVEGESAQQGPAEPMLRIGSRSPFVLELQRLLVSAGAKLQGDGVFGPATARAVMAFQRSAGLQPDGVVGPLTWGALRQGGAAVGAASPKHAEVLAKLAAVKQALRKVNAEQSAPVLPEVSAPRQGWFDDIVEGAESAAGAVVDTVSGVVESGGGSVVDSVIDIAQGAAGSVASVAAEVGQAAVGGLTGGGEGTGFVDAITGGVSSLVDAAAGAAEEFKEGHPEIFSTIEDIVGQLGKPLELGDDALDEIKGRLDGLLENIATGLIDQLPGVTELGGGGAGGSTTFTVVNASDNRNEETLNDVASALAARSEAGSTQPKIGDFTPSVDGNGRVTSVNITITETVTLPNWTKRDKQCEPIKNEWDRFHGALAAHEQGHVDIDKRVLGNLHAKLVGLPEDKVDAKVAAVQAQSDTENEAFDTSTNHGLNQGTGINAGIRCSEKV